MESIENRSFGYSFALSISQKVRHSYLAHIQKNNWCKSGIYIWIHANRPTTQKSLHILALEEQIQSKFNGILNYTEDYNSQNNLSCWLVHLKTLSNNTI